MGKRCAVCGDTTALNVKLAWRRDSDGKVVNVCCLCAESGKVNEHSIDNYTTEDTIVNVVGAAKSTKELKTMTDYYRKRTNLNHEPAKCNRRTRYVQRMKESL